MAVRIYALAKELKVDSKELVDICTKAGVPGKGSALASLTEEEVEKVKQFLKGGGTAKSKPVKAAPVGNRHAEATCTGRASQTGRACRRVGRAGAREHAGGNGYGRRNGVGS